MIYNVVTSFKRLQNLAPLARSLKTHDIIWHVVEDENPFHELVLHAAWMRYYRCPNHGGDSFWGRCHYALNWFMDRYIEKDQYYSFLNDDDDYEPGYWKKVDEVARKNNYVDEVMVTSMMRGDQTPEGVEAERAHGTTTLVASLENLRPGYVGLEQVIVKGSLLKKARLPMNVCGDGEMIEWLCHAYTPTLIPDAYVWFNYREPGRWQK